METRAQLGLYVVLATAVSVVSIQSLSQSEPSHAGRGLTAWLDDFDRGAECTYARATEAIGKIGTNALPRLLSLLQAEDSAFDRAMDNLAGPRAPFQFDWQSSFDRHWQALRGFEALGSEAAPAIPELTARLERGENPEFVSYALAGIGIDSLPSLQSGSTNRNVWVRRAATAALGLLGADAVTAVPALIERLSDANAEVRRNAAESLGKIGQAATEAIPALTTASSDGDFSVCQAALLALRRIDPR